DADMIATFARAPRVLQAALGASWPGADSFFDSEGPLFVIGRGPGLAIAAEAALKLKETNGLHAEAISAAEVRHGPLALAGPGLRAVLFAPNDAAAPGLRETASALERHGARVLLLAADTAISENCVAGDAEPTLEL